VDDSFVADGALIKGTYDMEISVGTDDPSDVAWYMRDWGKDKITMSPQMTNITKDEDGKVDFSIRNFWPNSNEGGCKDEEICNDVDLFDIDLVNGYPGEMIMILNDHRA